MNEIRDVYSLYTCLMKLKNISQVTFVDKLDIAYSLEARLFFVRMIKCRFVGAVLVLRAERYENMLSLNLVAT